MRTELSSLEQKLRWEPGLSGHALPHLVPPCGHAHPARLLPFPSQPAVRGPAITPPTVALPGGPCPAPVVWPVPCDPDHTLPVPPTALSLVGPGWT